MVNFFPYSSNFAIHGSQFTDASVTVNNNVMSKLQFLHQFTALGASHDSKDQDESPKCHEDTRVQLLADIYEWIAVPDKENGIMFLHGPAGTGKSCIARSTCHDAASKGLLVASFFFRRGTPDRGNANKFILTLAYQLARLDEQLAKHIFKEVSENPHITDMGIEDQFRRLIFNPCVAAATSGRLNIRAIIIDGLDECADNETQLKILHLMARATRNKRFPLGVIITSRLELHIQEALRSREIISEVHAISLTNVPNTRSNIFSDQRSIETLVKRSSDQFIYAATVMKFISSPVHNPTSRLGMVLGISYGSASSPFEDLDRLYHAILSTVLDPKRTIDVLRFIIALENTVQIVRDIKGYRIFAFFDVPQICLELIYGITYNHNRLLLVVEHLLGLPRGEAYLALAQLHSLISVDVENHNSVSGRSEIQFHHKSFQDFLFDQDRSKCFHINLEVAHADVANSCLQYLSQPQYETDEEHLCWFYCAFMWNYHCSHSNMNLVNIKSFDFSIRRLLFGPTYNLNHLSRRFWKRYIVSSDRKAGPNSRLFKATIEILQRNSMMPMKNIYKYVLHMWRTLEEKRNHSVCKYIVESFIFPVFVHIFKSYGSDFLVKNLLLLVVLLPSYSNNISNCLNTPDRVLEFAQQHLEDVHLKYRSDTLNHFFTIERIILAWLDLMSIPPTSVHRLTDYNRTWHDEAVEIIGHPPSCRDIFALFVSDKQNSGPFHCTANDWEQIYVKAVEFWRGDTIHWWMEQIHHLKPTPSLRLLDALKLTARYFRETVYASSELRHSSESCLMSWLEELNEPAQETIMEWKGLFQTARHLTVSKVDGYEYFCSPDRACNYCDSYQAASQTWVTIDQYQKSLDEASNT